MMEGNINTNTPKMDWLSGGLPGAWRSFKQHCEFMFGGPHKGKSEDQLCNYLMIWVGEKGRDIYNTWTLTGDESKKLKMYYEKFESHVKPKSNQVFARYKFHKKVQQESEPFEQFLTELKLLVKDCGYKDPDKMVRDRVVIRCCSQKVREKLIQEGSKLTLEQAIDIARTLELSHAQLQTMAGEDRSVEVHGLNTRQDESKSNRNPKKKQGQWESERNECPRCGFKNHDKREQCPAHGKKCAKCFKLHHYARVCKSKPEKQVHYVDEDSSASDDDFYVGCIETVNTVDTNEWYEGIAINQKVVRFQLDTGARCNVMPLHTFNQLETRMNLEKPVAKLKSYSGHFIDVKGIATLPCELKGRKYQVKFHIVNSEVPTVLSANTCAEMGLVQRIHAIESNHSKPSQPPPLSTHTSSVNTDKSDMLKDYPDLFSGLGCLPGEHTIKIDPAVSPVVHPPRKVPVAIKEKVKKELDRMESARVIVRQTEPTDWVSSMVTVIKPNKVRICLDPRDLNLAIKREHYPMKTIEEIVAKIPGAKVFLTLDAKSGFWQIKQSEESSKLCTFNSPFGRYRFTRPLFGIKSAPEIFQRTMSQLLHDIQGTEIVVDDILVWGRDVSENDARLKQVLN